MSSDFEATCAHPAVEKEIISLSSKKPLVWKRYIDDIFSLWNIKKDEIKAFIETANRYHSTIRFTAEISDKEITFLDTCVYKGSRFEQDSVLDLRTHFKPTETFQYTHFQSCHPVGVKKGFIKGKALRLLRTNSSQQIFEENICNFKLRLMSRGYPGNFIQKVLDEISFSDRKLALQTKDKTKRKILPFITQYNPSVLNLKRILMEKWHLIQAQPLLKDIFKEPPLISYKRGKSLRDILVRAKL